MTRRQLSVNKKAWIVKHIYRLEYPINVQRLWCRELNNNPPHRDTIRLLMNKFEQTGSVLNIDPPGRPVSATGDTAKDEISSILEKEPRTSTCRMRLRLSIRRSSVQRVYKSLGYKSYIPRLVQELNEDNFDRRVGYCNKFLSIVLYGRMRQYLNSMDILTIIILPIGQLKTQMSHERLQCRLKGSLCRLGSWSQGVIGPYFFDRTVTGQSYLTILNDYFYPEFCDLPGNESLVFTQDLISCDWLDENFSGR
jgi:hypothetical protein